MPQDKSIKVAQVFESYPLFYQPYIPPVLEAIRQYRKIKLEIYAFNGVPDMDVTIIPSYFKRQVKEKWFAITHKSSSRLNYAEIKFKNEQVDIVHLQHSFLFPKVKSLLELSKNERPKIIITLRGGDTYVKPWIGEKWSNFYKNYGRNVDGFIVMSHNQKQYLHEKWGIDLNRIHIIPISFGVLKEVKPKLPDAKVIKITSAFRMCWEKNIDGNLQVIKYLKEKGVPIQYKMYGDGPDSGQVPYLIDKYKLSDCVTYHGKIENSRLKVAVAESDFFLQLSHSESLGMSVIEAQALGVPAIVSNSGGLPEVICNEKSGYCVETNDIEHAAEVIVMLWKNKEKYNSFSENAIKHANANFSVKLEVNKLIELYHNILS